MRERNHKIYIANGGTRTSNPRGYTFVPAPALKRRLKKLSASEIRTIRQRVAEITDGLYFGSLINYTVKEKKQINAQVSRYYDGWIKSFEAARALAAEELKLKRVKAAKKAAAAKRAYAAGTRKRPAAGAAKKKTKKRPKRSSARLAGRIRTGQTVKSVADNLGLSVMKIARAAGVKISKGYTTRKLSARQAERARRSVGDTPSPTTRWAKAQRVVCVYARKRHGQRHAASLHRLRQLRRDDGEPEDQDRQLLCQRDGRGTWADRP